MSLYTDASLIMFPSGYKEDKIYSLKPTDGSGDLTFTRASTATRVNADGLIETSPVNLLEYSEDLSNAYWLKRGFTQLATNATAPDGSATAYKIQENNTDDNPGVVVTDFVIPNGANTFFVWLKGDSNYTLNLSTNGGVSGSTINITTSWQLFSVTQTDTPYNGPHIGGFGTIARDSGIVIYVWHPQLNSGATAKPYFPTTDRLNVPRIDYTGGGCGSLLLEKQSTNLLTYSSELSNAAWTKFNSSITANATTSPDGTTNADKTVEDTANSSHGAYNSASITNGIDYTWSAFFKAGERTLVRVLAQTGTTPVVVFNLTNGTIVSVSAGVTGSIEDYGNGWYRCILTATSSSTTAYFNWNMLNAAGDVTYTGDGTSGLYAYGFQIEQSSYPTSYIPTLASSVTRLADSASKTGISSLINSVEGVLYINTSTPINDATAGVISVSDGTLSNRCILFYGVGNISARLTVGGVNSIVLSKTFVTSDYHKIAARWNATTFDLYVDGVFVSSTANSSFSANTLTSLQFNAGSGANNFLGNAQSVQVLSYLTDTQMVALTTL